jgi:hypothetical protein
VSAVGLVDATLICLEEIGVPVTNTCMMGAFARTSPFPCIPKNIINHGDTEIAEKRIFCLSRKLSGQTKTISPFGVGSSSKERGAVGDWILSMPVPGPLNAELFDWGLPALKNKKFSVFSVPLW